MELTDTIISTLVGVGAAALVGVLGLQVRIWLRLQRVPDDIDHLRERVDVIERMVFQGFTGRSGV
jgi:DNA-binding PucR family transcriptional regulator